LWKAGGRNAQMVRPARVGESRGGGANRNGDGGDHSKQKTGTIDCVAGGWRRSHPPRVPQFGETGAVNPAFQRAHFPRVSVTVE